MRKPPSTDCEASPLQPPEYQTIELSTVHQFSGQVRRAKEVVRIDQILYAEDRAKVTERLWRRLLGEGS